MPLVGTLRNGFDLLTAATVTLNATTNGQSRGEQPVPTNDRSQSGSQPGRQGQDQKQTQNRDNKQTSGSEDRTSKSGMSGTDNQQKSSGTRDRNDDR